jgi:hypothetical protein
MTTNMRMLSTSVICTIKSFPTKVPLGLCGKLAALDTPENISRSVEEQQEADGMVLSGARKDKGGLTLRKGKENMEDGRRSPRGNV